METDWFTDKIKLILQSTNAISEEAVVEVGPLDKSFSCQNLKSVKVYNNVSKNEVQMNLVVKVLTGSDELQDLFIDLYRNEITMYTKVVPQLGDSIQSMLPKIVFSTPFNEITRHNAIIILEDLSYLGYKPTKSTFLNYKELKVALTKIGQFHGENYALKILIPQEYQKLQCLLKGRYFPKTKNGVYEYARDFIDSTLLMFCDRITKNSPGSEITVKVRKLIDQIKRNSALAITRKLRISEEPLPIICHGDFNANNLMFKYNDQNNVDCKLIDLQQSSYTNPMVELAFLLFMNVESVQFLRENWNEIWEIYHSALTGVLKFRLGSHVKLPDYLSLKHLQDEFLTKSFISCHVVIFFQPVTRGTFDDFVNTQLAERVKRFGLKLNIEEDAINNRRHEVKSDVSKLATSFITEEERIFFEDTYKRIMLNFPAMDNNLEALLMFVLENASL